MVISIAALVGAVLTYGTVNTTYTVALLLVGCMYTLIHPFSVYSKCKATRGSQRLMRSPFEYVFRRGQFSVTRGDQHVGYKWESIARVKRRGQYHDLYGQDPCPYTAGREAGRQGRGLLTLIGEHTAGRGQHKDEYNRDILSGGTGKLGFRLGQAACAGRYTV